MKLLVINSGSSSIKYKLFEMADKRVLCSGLIERIGEANAKVNHQLMLSDGQVKSQTEELAVKNHHEGLEIVSKLLQDDQVGAIRNPQEINVVGHRVVHGGSEFDKAVKITEDVKKSIEKLISLAPLHNPANLQGIAVAEEVFPAAVQVAVFDTAFHQSMPEYAFRYAIPKKYYQEDKLRVYGMHGTSHQYVAKEAAKFLEKDMDSLNAISIHLGNGCSMCAIKNGKSIDTSMGLSPLPGLMMGTRSGDIDPAVIFYMGNTLGMSFQEIDQVLNKQSGLKGISGDNDLRNIISRMEEDDPEATLAIEMYSYRIRKYIGAYSALIGPLDSIIFTAGVGENSSLIRAKSCAELSHLGIQLDEEKNQERKKGVVEIQLQDSFTKILVVPTDEELSIAEQATTLVE